jgi:hypothetical protein
MSEINKKSCLAIISIGLLTVPAFVMARPADPNRFPKYEPLHAPAPNALPNLKGNINFLPDDQTRPSGQASEEGFRIGSENGDQNVAPLPEELAQYSNKRQVAVVLVALFAVILGYVFFLWRKAK